MCADDQNVVSVRCDASTSRDADRYADGRHKGSAPEYDRAEPAPPGLIVAGGWIEGEPALERPGRAHGRVLGVERLIRSLDASNLHLRRRALGRPLSQILSEVTTRVERAEAASAPVPLHERRATLSASRDAA